MKLLVSSHQNISPRSRSSKMQYGYRPRAYWVAQFRMKWTYWYRDANRSVYTKRVLYLTYKICVLYGYSRNLYFTGAQNLYFAGFFMHSVPDLHRFNHQKIEPKCCLLICNMMFLLILSIIISIDFIYEKCSFSQNNFYGWCSVFYNLNLYFFE